MNCMRDDEWALTDRLLTTEDVTARCQAVLRRTAGWRGLSVLGIGLTEFFSHAVPRARFEGGGGWVECGARGGVIWARQMKTGLLHLGKVGWLITYLVGKLHRCSAVAASKQVFVCHAARCFWVRSMTMPYMYVVGLGEMQVCRWRSMHAWGRSSVKVVLGGSSSASRELIDEID
jgi:hypothetical protein